MAPSDRTPSLRFDLYVDPSNNHVVGCSGNGTNPLGSPVIALNVPAATVTHVSASWCNNGVKVEATLSAERLDDSNDGLYHGIQYGMSVNAHSVGMIEFGATKFHGNGNESLYKVSGLTKTYYISPGQDVDIQGNVTADQFVQVSEATYNVLCL